MSPGGSDEHDSLNESKTAVAKNAASGYLTLGLSAILGLVATPILLGHLGTEQFGLWAVLLGAIAYVGLCELGLGAAAVTEMARTESEGESAMSQVASTVAVLFAGAAVFGLVVTTLLALLVTAIFDIPASLETQARAATFLLGVWQSLVFIGNGPVSTLLGTGRMYLVNLNGFIVSSLVTAGQAAAALHGEGIVVLAGIQVVGAILLFLALRTGVHRNLTELTIRANLFSRVIARRLIALGSRNAVSSVAGVLAYGSDVVLVGLLVGPRGAAAYAIALRGYNLMQRLATGVISAMGSVHARAAATGTFEHRFSLLASGFFATTALALLVALPVAVFAHPLLHLWLGSVPPHSAEILLVLCAVLVLQAPGMNVALMLTNAQRADIAMRYTAAAAGINVVASLTLTQLYGTLGPALGSLIAVLAVEATWLPMRGCALLEQRYADLVNVVRPLILPVLAMLACTIPVRLLTEDVVMMIASIGVGTAAFGVLTARTERGRRVLNARGRV